MDAIGAKVINTSNYSSTNDIKKTDIKEQGAIQDLGTDTFVKSTEDETTNSTYKPIPKKLSPEEIKILKDEQENLKTDLIKKFISDTINNQNKLLGKSAESGINVMPKETLDFVTKTFGTVENAYPLVAITPEGAKKALAEGGSYSVSAVADRIMTMAKAIAGDDPSKIQQMRDAVEKGFSQAGQDFNKATNSDLPQICKDTCAEVMKRFDKLQNKTSSAD